MDLEKPLGYLLCRARRVYKNKLMIQYKERKIDLSLNQFIILQQLGLNKEMTQQELADYLKKDKSIILRQIHSLVDRKYILRLHNEKDKRKKILTITSEGQNILKLSLEIAQSVSRELLTGVSPEEQEIFRNVIEKIQKNGGFEENMCCN